MIRFIVQRKVTTFILLLCFVIFRAVLGRSGGHSSSGHSSSGYSSGGSYHSSSSNSHNYGSSSNSHNYGSSSNSNNYGSSSKTTSARYGSRTQARSNSGGSRVYGYPYYRNNNGKKCNQDYVYDDYTGEWKCQNEYHTYYSIAGAGGSLTVILMAYLARKRYKLRQQEEIDESEKSSATGTPDTSTVGSDFQVLFHPISGLYYAEYRTAWFQKQASQIQLVFTEDKDTVNNDCCCWHISGYGIDGFGNEFVITDGIVSQWGHATWNQQTKTNGISTRTHTQGCFHQNCTFEGFWKGEKGEKVHYTDFHLATGPKNVPQASTEGETVATVTTGYFAL